MRKSTGEYPDNWPGIAKLVKAKAGHKCVRCGHKDDTKAGYMLTVHHLDLNKSNCAWWNIPALCQRCHLRIQGKVNIGQIWALEHSEWFKIYVAGYYAHLLGWREDRAYVEEHKEIIIQRYFGV